MERAFSSAVTFPSCPNRARLFRFEVRFLYRLHFSKHPTISIFILQHSNGISNRKFSQFKFEFILAVRTNSLHSDTSCSSFGAEHFQVIPVWATFFNINFKCIQAVTFQLWNAQFDCVMIIFRSASDDLKNGRCVISLPTQFLMQWCILVWDAQHISQCVAFFRDDDKSNHLVQEIYFRDVANLMVRLSDRFFSKTLFRFYHFRFQFKSAFCLWG